jgi:hypothetical protein
MHAAIVGVCLVAPVAAASSRPAAQHARAAAQQKPDKESNAASDQVLRDAIAQLQAIKERVHSAAKMYGGHRGRADEHIDAAIRELQAALNFDEKRERK